MNARRLAPCAAALALSLLSGCGLSRGIYSNYRPLEELQLVETLGADADEGGVLLSASAGTDAAGGGAVRSARADALVPGLEALQDRAVRGQVFFAHTQYLVLGQGFAEAGVGGPVLVYAEHVEVKRRGRTVNFNNVAVCGRARDRDAVIRKCHRAALIVPGVPVIGKLIIGSVRAGRGEEGVLVHGRGGNALAGDRCGHRLRRVDLEQVAGLKEQADGACADRRPERGPGKRLFIGAQLVRDAAEDRVLGVKLGFVRENVFNAHVFRSLP